MKDNPLPMMEMHTAHLNQAGTNIYVVGGRIHYPGVEDCGGSQSIYNINLVTKEVSTLAGMASMLLSHASTLVNDRYIILYGGTDGLGFVERVTRYDILKESWSTLSKLPPHLMDSAFVKEGRIASVMTTVKNEASGKDEFVIVFGGSSQSQDWADFAVLSVEDIENEDIWNNMTALM